METVRYHTEGRRQPMLIGKDSAGHKIWGGPYTVYQLLGLLLVPALASTRSVWGPALTPLAAGVTIAGLTALTVWGLGLVDFTRNPFHAATSMASLLRSAAGGPDRRLTRGTVIRGTVTQGRAHTVLLAGADHPPRADQPTPGGQKPNPAPLPGATPAAAHLLLSNPPRPAPPPGSVPGPTPARPPAPPASQVAPMTVRSPLDQFLEAATRSGDDDS